MVAVHVQSDRSSWNGAVRTARIRLLLTTILNSRAFAALRGDEKGAFSPASLAQDCLLTTDNREKTADLFGPSDALIGVRSYG